MASAPCCCCRSLFVLSFVALTGARLPCWVSAFTSPKEILQPYAPYFVPYFVCRISFVAPPFFEIGVIMYRGGENGGDRTFFIKMVKRGRIRRRLARRRLSQGDLTLGLRVRNAVTYPDTGGICLPFGRVNQRRWTIWIQQMTTTVSMIIESFYICMFFEVRAFAPVAGARLIHGTA